MFGGSGAGLAGSGQRRWPAAKKLQRGGELSRDQLIEFLEKVAAEIASPGTVEVLCMVDPQSIPQLLAAWQCELLEHMGIEQGFGRSQIKKFAQEKADDDLELQAKFTAIQTSSAFTVQASGQENDLRASLELKPYDPTDPELDADCVCDRRVPRAPGPLRSEGVISREDLLKYCEDATRLVMSRETRVQLSGLIRSYSTWEAQKRQRLLHNSLLKWQLDIFEALGYDRRLGNLAFLAIEHCTPVDEELVKVKVGLLAAYQAVDCWAKNQPAKGRQPATIGDDKRRIAPHSELAAAGLPVSTAAVDADGPASLQDEDPVNTSVLLAYMRKVEELQNGEWGDAAHEQALAGDVFAVERWRNELLQGFGLDHDFGGLCLQLLGTGAIRYSEGSDATVTDEVLFAARSAFEESAGKIKTRVEAGLRNRMAAAAQAKK